MPNCNAGLVSVLMSVYNGAPTLEKAAASVLAQTYRDLELILCDDASTDDTWRIMQRIAAQDARVTIFQNKTNLGLGASLNECLARAQGAYIARQDADDVSDSDRIERTMDFLLSSGAPYAACGVRGFRRYRRMEHAAVSAEDHEAHHRAEESLLPPDDALPPRRARERERLQHLPRNAPHGGL